MARFGIDRLERLRLATTRGFQLDNFLEESPRRARHPTNRFKLNKSIILHDLEVKRCDNAYEIEDIPFIYTYETERDAVSFGVLTKKR